MAISSGRNRSVGAEGCMAFLVLLLVLILVGVDARGLDVQRQAQPSATVIRTADGDTFDCVDIYKQPAFDHPLLKNHQLQMRPSSHPEDLRESDVQETLHARHGFENDECPDGTVPIMRVNKHVQQMKDIQVPNFESTHPSASEGVQTYVAGIETNPTDVYGGGASLNVYALPNVGDGQLSAALVRVSDADNLTRTTYNVVEAGWMVNPTLFHDDKTRFYIHWTADAFQSTGCYNMLCPGFVHTGKFNPIGGAVRPLSTYGGLQYIVRATIHKDRVTGNWWLAYGTKMEVVGYWPREIFYGFDKARVLTFGGMVKSPPGVQLPRMGNGHFAEEPNQQACFVKGVAYVDSFGGVQDLTAEGQHGVETNHKCYSITPYWEKYHMFRFGGTGYCP